MRKNIAKYRRKGGISARIVRGVAFVFLVIIACILLYPFAFAINSSLKADDPSFLMEMNKLSIPPRFRNYIDAFTALKVGDTTYAQMFFNSIWYSVGRTVLNIFFSLCLAYAVACYNFKGKDFLYKLVLFVLVLPSFGTLAARYKLYDSLGMIDSPLILLAYCGAFDGIFLILYAFFKGISWDYAESAFIDGASHAQVFFKIMIPMVMPAAMTMAVTNFIIAWNDYSSVLLYMPSLPTLTSGLYSFDVLQRYAADRPIFYAGLIISIIPIFIIFLVMQNSIMSQVYVGGVKE